MFISPDWRIGTSLNPALAGNPGKEHLQHSPWVLDNQLSKNIPPPFLLIRL